MSSCAGDWAPCDVYVLVALAILPALMQLVAHPDPLGRAINKRLHRLQIHIPPSPRNIVRVRNVIAKLRAFPANIAYLCHDFTPIPYVSAGAFGVPKGTLHQQLAESPVYPD